MVSVPEPQLAETAQFSLVDLGDTARVSLMLAPRSRGSFGEQLREIMASMEGILRQQPFPMSVVTQTLFLRSPGTRRSAAGFWVPITARICR